MKQEYETGVICNGDMEPACFIDRVVLHLFTSFNGIEIA